MGQEATGQQGVKGRTCLLLLGGANCVCLEGKSRLGLGQPAEASVRERMKAFGGHQGWV